MRQLGAYVISLTTAALITGILLSLFSDGAAQKLLRLVCGIVLTVTALQPLTRLKLPDLSGMLSEYQEMGAHVAAMGQEMAEAERLGRITQALEAYILEKARAMGMDAVVELALDELGNPISVRIRGTYTAHQRKQLQSIITNDLGIPEEDQTWTTKRENEP